MMEVVPVRLPSSLIRDIDNFVKSGYYANKSDVIRDALRLLALRRQIGSIPNTGDSVQEVREIRKKLSKMHFDLDDINQLRGVSKKKISNDEYERVRRKAFRDL